MKPKGEDRGHIQPVAITSTSLSPLSRHLLCSWSTLSPSVFWGTPTSYASVTSSSPMVTITDRSILLGAVQVLSNINYLLKLDFPEATFELFPLFQWKRLKK